MRKNSTSQLVTIAVFIAIEVILTRFLSIQTPIVRLGFGFLPVAMLAILYGPIWAGVAYAIGDILGMLIWPSGSFFFGFTLSAFRTGMIYGFFFKNHDIRLPKVLIACALVCFVINLGLDTVGLSILQGQAYLASACESYKGSYCLCASGYIDSYCLPRSCKTHPCSEGTI